MNEPQVTGQEVGGAKVAPPTTFNGGIYWLARHTCEALISFVKRHSRFFGGVLAVTFVGLLLARAWVQPYFLYMRVHSAAIIGSVAFVLLLRICWITRRKWSFWILIAMIGSIVTFLQYSKLSPHEYLTLYFQYKSLKVRDIATIPETAHERIQPIHSVYTLANEAMSVVEQCSEPHVVRTGEDDYKFTLAIEPTYRVPRFFGSVKQVLSVDATAAALNFSAENRVSVNFPTAEKMFLGKNTLIAVTRTFGPWRYFAYKAMDVRYMYDDGGKMVQVVPLLRYPAGKYLSGLLFPRPEFGGVQVLHQNEGGFMHFVKSLFVGEGDWIRPEDVSNHKFLLRQNIVPYEVARYFAESFRFQDGFFAPFPGYHRGDVRIPDLEGDMNDQPFTLYFKFEQGPGEPASKLYHYFALEPYDPEKQGLNTSVFIPADGNGEVLAYRHHNYREALVGVSAIGAKVQASQKMIDWSQNSIAEMRPYFRKIDGKVRFFWLSTIVTYKNANQKEGFIAGSAPQVTLTDALYQQCVWVDSANPDSWVPKLKEELARIWGVR